MLTELRIKNFKSWRDTNTIHLAPLTIFFGTNSSGKSSLNQLLLMLKQTAQSQDRQRVLHPGGHGTIVDIGTFEELLHCESAREKVGSKAMEFAVTWTLERKMDVQDSTTGEVYSGQSIRFEASVAKRSGKGQEIAVNHMSYILGDVEQAGLKVEWQRSAETNRYKLVADPIKIRKTERTSARSVSLSAPTHFYGFPNEVTALYKDVDFVRDLTLEFENFLLRDLQYLGPLRAVPQRSYTWSGEIPEHVGTRGDRAVDAILAAHDRKISGGKNKRPAPFAAVVARWMTEMGLIEKFQVKAIGQHRRDYEVLVKTHSIKEGVNITDVGFGVSQVLPVIVECFYAQPKSTIIIEQPEVHLHPKAQASLADLFIETIQAREDGEDRNIQLLVESHSEHLLTRLQRRIAEKKIASAAVAIYFCRSDSLGSTIERLMMDELGNIINWPPEFFGDTMGDAVAMTNAQMQRLQASEHLL